MSTDEPSGDPPDGAPCCYVHGDRTAGSVCRRCSRPICPECMREAPVGWQCTNCVRDGARRSPVISWRPRGTGGVAGDGRLGGRITPVVAALVVANVVVYIWEQHTASRVVARFAMSPQRVHANHEWYRLITAAFLHASFQHIFFNMATLAIIGPPLESALGKVRFSAVYLVAALGGSVASYLLSSASEFGVGASGAIFGLLGSYLVMARRHGWDMSTIVGLIVVNLAIGFAPTGFGVGRVDWRAHVGGLLSGAVVTVGLARTVGRGDRRARARLVREAALGATVVGVAVVGLGLLVLISPGQVNL